MGSEDTDPRYHEVTLTLCALCLDGAGGECHSPGCALWINRAPDLPLRDHPFVHSIDGQAWNGDCTAREPTLWPLPKFLSACRDGVGWFRYPAAVWLTHGGRLVWTDGDGRDHGVINRADQRDIQYAITRLVEG